MAQQPVQSRAQQHHHVTAAERQRAGRRHRLGMVVGKQTLGHGHGQERDPGGLDELANLVLGPRIGGALADHDQGPLGGGE